MKTNRFLILLFVFLFAAASALAFQQPEGWACPPCGHDHDDRVYEQPGACPICNMPLITVAEKQQLAERARRDRKTVGILLFDGVQIIDFTGPYEVFGQARFRVFTVSQTGQPLTTSMGLRVTPDHSFANSPTPDILLVPGGSISPAMSSAAALEWVRRRSAESEYTLSVCNGAFILAEAGLLENRTATTFYGLLDDFESRYPKVNVVRDQRYTDNGKILTSAGLSSGIDASLYLVSKVLGMGRAQEIALHLEYDWNPDSNFARAALADRYMPDLRPPDGIDLELLETGGDRKSWSARYRLIGEVPTAEILEKVKQQLSAQPGGAPAPTAGSDRLDWTFSNAGGAWNATCRIESHSNGRIAVVSIQKKSG